ncbi:MAG: hypothetical protein FWD81_03665 [Methanomassiliicoccaceae archaeon]|nr:hypothetical protein [Methanomassiliicoccaceae archaeon]
MMMILRSLGYDDVLRASEGRRVSVWTCNTCAKLCGVGGQTAADKLAEKLKKDGVNVTSCVSVSAACITAKVIRAAAEIPVGTDMVIALTCDIGVTTASDVFKKDVLAPLATVGFGFADENGSPMVTSCHGSQTPVPLSKIAAERGMYTDPLV